MPSELIFRIHRLFRSDIHPKKSVLRGRFKRFFVEKRVFFWYKYLNYKNLNKKTLMAIISEQYLFSWKDCNELGDLERLKLTIDHIPDKKLISKFRTCRSNGRNDHPIQAMWNSILAGVVFEHKSAESLRRELKRNAQLRELCGFNPLMGARCIPSKSAYSRFLINLIKHQDEIDQIFHSLVKSIRSLLPEFGKELAFDGKAIPSVANKKTEGNHLDRRKEQDADWGKKKYKGTKKDGTSWEKIKLWFGFRLHLIVDANYELPVSYSVTKASCNEQPVMRDLFDDLAKTHAELIEGCEHAMGDKGYDSKKTIEKLWKDHKIKPIIDIKNCWKDKKETRQLESIDIRNVTYNYKGDLFCHCPTTGAITELTYGGFEKDRSTLKYTCPAKQYGIACVGAAKCPMYNKSIRIPLGENKRIFTPVARSSYKWKTLYKKRTSVERVNSRLDVSFGFENHYIRGLKKMNLRCGLALCVMLSMALGRIKKNQSKLIRSLVRTA